MYELIPSEEYLSDLIQLVKKAKKNIYIQAMYVYFDDSLKEFTKEVIAAKKRGVSVKFNIDNYSNQYIQGHKYFIHINKEKRDKCKNNIQISQKYFKEMTSADIEINFINEYRYNKAIAEYFPFIGRNHMKITIIDNYSYIGGMNFGKKSFNYYDFMVKTKDREIRNNLKSIFLKNSTGIKYSDKIVNINKENSLLIDSGKKGQSIIYNEAINAINNAKEDISYISQFLPDFKILFALQKAVKRGLAVEIIVHSNSIAEKKIRHKIEQILFNLSNINLSNLYEQSEKYIHAKMIILDKNAPNSSLIIGSHNFSTFGVLFGTSEIALNTKDKDLIHNLSNWYTQIKLNSQSLIKYTTPSQSIKQG